jgi:hypothetical protein
LATALPPNPAKAFARPVATAFPPSELALPNPVAYAFPPIPATALPSPSA